MWLSNWIKRCVLVREWRDSSVADIRTGRADIGARYRGPPHRPYKGVHIEGIWCAFAGVRRCSSAKRGHGASQKAQRCPYTDPRRTSVGAARRTPPFVLGTARESEPPEPLQRSHTFPCYSLVHCLLSPYHRYSRDVSLVFSLRIVSVVSTYRLVV